MLSDHPAAAAHRLSRRSILAALLLTLPVTQSAKSQQECSKPELHVRVAFIQGLEEQLNRDGVYLTVELFEHRDRYKAIGSDVDLMRFTGLQ